MKCIALFIVALTFLASHTNASDEAVERTTTGGSAFSEAVISVLTVDACKYGAELTTEAPPSGIRCRMREMDLVAEFMFPDSTIPKVVACIHLSTQQKLQIRETIKTLVSDVLEKNEQVETNIIVGTRTPVKLNLTGIPYYESYPKRYDSLPSEKDINDRKETLASFVNTLPRTRAHTLNGGEDLSKGYESYSKSLPNSKSLSNSYSLEREHYCTSIQRLQRRASSVRKEYLEQALKDDNLPPYVAPSRFNLKAKAQKLNPKLPQRRAGCCVSPYSEDDEENGGKNKKGLLGFLRKGSFSFSKSKKAEEKSDGPMMADDKTDGPMKAEGKIDIPKLTRSATFAGRRRDQLTSSLGSFRNAIRRREPLAKLEKPAEQA